MSCTLYATNDDGTTSACVTSGSGAVTPNAAGTMMMAVPGTTFCNAAYIQCSIPDKTWISNLKWNPFASPC
jgi:hypothetical protein